MVVPIRKIIRNRRLLSLLESQYSSDIELGVELVERSVCGVVNDCIMEKYRVYSKIGD